MRPFLPLLFFTLVVSCAAAPEDRDTEMEFFDLKGFVAGEVERLSGQPTLVEKTITLNGKTETREISDLDFATDLQLFSGADINKAAWTEKYETATEELSGGHRITTYTAVDSTLVTQKLEVEEDRGEATRIRILRRTGSVLSKGRGELEYRPAEGYSVTTRHDNRFGDDVDAVVRVRWK